jgi:hypothetical protein
MSDAEIKTHCPETEWSRKFIVGMLNRMEVSFHKYGPVKDAYPFNVDAIASLKQRLAKYAEDGNTEWLMDVANFAMIEFMLPGHPEAHYAAQDSDTSPGRTGVKGVVSDARNDSRKWW